MDSDVFAFATDIEYIIGCYWWKKTTCILALKTSLFNYKLRCWLSVGRTFVNSSGAWGLEQTFTQISLSLTWNKELVFLFLFLVRGIRLSTFTSRQVIYFFILGRYLTYGGFLAMLLLAWLSFGAFTKNALRNRSWGRRQMNELLCGTFVGGVNFCAFRRLRLSSQLGGRLLIF